MNNENQFFSLNHIEHFRSGFCYGLNTDGETPSFSGSALFVSHAFDTCGQGTVWHRARIWMDCEKVTWYSLAFYAADSKRIRLSDGTMCDLDLLLQSTFLTDAEKARILPEADIWSREYIGVNDILLHDFQGRYLWLKLTVRGNSKIPRIRLYYPAVSFMRYLPESYQGDIQSFWVRFIAVFQSLYLDIDEKIAAFPSELDPEAASEDSLRAMTKWLGLTPFWSIGSEKMRELIRRALGLYRIWGTRKSLEELLQIICGQKPYIQEHYLRGGDPFGFTVLLDRDEFTITNQKLLISIIDFLKPAHTTYNLVLLKQAFILDVHTYLGVNSRLSEYTPIRIDERTSLGVHTLGTSSKGSEE